ncbi:hypothetical protein Tsubulata_027759 [Turnera subulata]|uniref:Translation initiation factor beta propellor-like domain-containing protein n=1 Tax=Turnera subulata TaxID=218843 RepID=A0A9Q0JLP6_9ROSI|nr:hypothetical protein Tsubulata_027759 [Turnera subulata]
MDLLCTAYSNSDDDEDPEPEPEPEPEPAPDPGRCTFSLPPPKLPKRDIPPASFPREAPIPGRYISKRERALSGQSTQVTVETPNPPVINNSPVIGSVSESDIPVDILKSLKNGKKQSPQSLSVALPGHTKAVNSINWSPIHTHLLASAGMDHTVCVWNVWSKSRGEKKLARAFKFHNAAVKDVKWSPRGGSLVSCGYDCCSRLVDVEKGQEIRRFEEDQVVGAIKFHPHNHNMFLSGGSKGRIRLWDVRVGKVVHDYIRNLGQVLDVEFSTNGKQFVSSSDVSGGNVSENSIVVWDVSRQIPLSNQLAFPLVATVNMKHEIVYVEAYTCPCIRRHPVDPCFVAQSNGNYIAIFSSISPFKLDKYKRFESHAVSGFPIKCNFSMDGEKLASGSSDGSIYYYSYRSSQLVRKIKAYDHACIDVEFHPVFPDVIASCSWNGDVSVFE